MVVGVDWRGLVLVVVVGVCIGLVTGFVENPPEVSVIGHKYYGWPFVWRITKVFLGEEYLYFELFVDCLFWFFVVAVVYLVVRKLVKG
ncbi:MAG: hypothetical protein OEY95_01820 [Candidatus Bathyarchaeota archaeon]|nr:hypothetical protein [Candidatus Bathyarchaeota archaeon]